MEWPQCVQCVMAGNSLDIFITRSEKNNQDLHYASPDAVFNVFFSSFHFRLRLRLLTYIVRALKKY